jgi:O-antigen/teichoic acid export membrane protein
VSNSTVRSALRSLAGASFTYGLGSVIARGLNFALVPLYTRFLSPTDYGVMSLTVTVIAVLGVLYPLGLHSAVTRSYYGEGSEEERRRRVGTLALTVLLASTVLALLLNWLGPALARRALPQVPFDPYLRLGVWTAYLMVFGLVPLVLLQVQERPKAYVLITVCASVAASALAVTFGVVYGKGAYGVLLGGLLGAALAAGPYLWLTFRNVPLTLDWPVLVPALAFSLPLIPHAFASWALEMSDRTVLSRYVPLGDVGLYALGYQLGAAMGLLNAAFNSAWVPFLFRSLAEEGSAAHRRLTRVATYYVWSLCFVGLGWSLLVKHAIVLVAGPAFREAYHVTPWVVGGYICSGLYLIPANLLFWKSATRIIPVITIGAGALNVGLNLWLVPRVGYIAAAWSTLAGYGSMLIFAWWAARRICPFPYEYRRLGLALGLTIGLLLAGSSLPYPNAAVEALVRTGLWLSFVPGLIGLGAIDSAELAVLAGYARRLRARTA